ncbi:uncharacterized protein BDZ99DRAFT_465892 [Mytilinidion resinicola]|uniref:Protein kinase domain-containing protein n=1 Tax=Mytilinidion resinicola TaxID=574789 RepID=A0A6A6YE16_9PEZI|nr:uncharacterized protein BDZ99DRAFT_465892 [Mytilinidion resinicola]KAF2806244.1 hypothetical protein BDZ99DRAFT_465892 [Mytilinidion resinicola]
MFGIVYKFPSDQTRPVRLHHLLRGRDRSSILVPHVGEKITLAATLAQSLYTFHISEWLHKNINSRNVLFFTGLSNFRDIDLSRPYVVGFNHSREADVSAYTEGPEMSSEWEKYQKYQDPDYVKGSRYKKGYDYYSFGLLLLEIGTWERLSNIHDKHETEDSSQLRKRYLRICDNVILERMGPTYHQATKACLLFDSGLPLEKLDSAMEFRKNVVDRLATCHL